MPDNILLEAGLSLVAGATVAAVIDGGRRLLARNSNGAFRFIRTDCGEHVAFVPMRAVGIAGVFLGFAIAYTSF